MSRTAGQTWRTIARSQLSQGGVSEGTGFGKTAGLRVEGKIFAMFMNDRLVVKLPRERVDELVASGLGERFDPGHGRVMKEWIAIDASRSKTWPSLVADARQFVGAAAAPRQKSAARSRRG